MPNQNFIYQEKYTKFLKFHIYQLQHWVRVVCKKYWRGMDFDAVPGEVSLLLTECEVHRLVGKIRHRQDFSCSR